MIINKYLTGWAHLEPIIFASIAKGYNILLLGKHGVGKTSLMQMMANALSNGDEVRFQKYAMDKENPISMIGIPNSQALKEGRIEYAKHERSIFNADIVLLDEVTRATKETQNLVLEILEERTCFGKPLKYKFAVVTANDETYSGAFKLDAALLDRFFCVVPAPTPFTHPMGAEELKGMIGLNAGKRDENIQEVNLELRDLIVKINKTYDELWNTKNIKDNVIEFCSRFFSMVIDVMKDINKSQKSHLYISPRHVAYQFPRLIMALAAYFKVVRKSDLFLELAAAEAIKYSLNTKLGFPEDKTAPIFKDLKELLTTESTELSAINIALSTGTLQSRIDTFVDKYDIIKDNMMPDVIVNVIGNILHEIKPTLRSDVSGVCKLLELCDTKEVDDKCDAAIRFATFDIVSNLGIAVDEACTW